MDLTHIFSVDPKGRVVTIRDTTDWEGSIYNREDFTVVFALVTTLGDNVWQSCPLAPGNNPIKVGEGDSCSFEILHDGHYYTRVIYAMNTQAIDRPISDIAYNQSSGFSFFNSTAWQPTSLTNLSLEQINRNGVETTRMGIAPAIEKKLDSMIAEHSESGAPAGSVNFKNFLTGYALMVGAISSLRQEAWLEYDRKVKIITKLAKRW